MDFVVSKVAMSICALLVIGVLSGAVGSQDRELLVDELDAMVTHVCSLVDRAVLTGAEASMRWSVPDLASGDPVTVSIRAGIVRAASGGQECAGQPQAGVHTWTWAGVCLNESAVYALDGSSEPVELTSGDDLVLSTELVLLDDEPTILAFAHASG
jgi:hypothetical protein